MVQRTDIGDRQALAGFALTVPNAITLARLFAVPIAVWLILDGRYALAFWVFIAAGVSDALDGYIAKRFDGRSRLGALLDPLADKALLTSVYVALALSNQLPGWLVVLVVLRDALIVAGFLLIQATAAPRRFEPLYISKVNTLLQIALVGFVLARLGLDLEDLWLTPSLVDVVAATTVISGFWYLARILMRSETVDPDSSL